jgi:hypothetical protein
MGVGGNPCRSDVSGMERLRVAPHRLLQGKDAAQSNHDLLKGEQVNADQLADAAGKALDRGQANELVTIGEAELL